MNEPKKPAAKPVEKPVDTHVLVGLSDEKKAKEAAAAAASAQAAKVAGEIEIQKNTKRF